MPKYRVLKEKAKAATYTHLRKMCPLHCPRKYVLDSSTVFFAASNLPSFPNPKSVLLPILKMSVLSPSAYASSRIDNSCKGVRPESSSQAHQHTFHPDAIVDWNGLTGCMGTLPNKQDFRQDMYIMYILILLRLTYYVYYTVPSLIPVWFLRVLQMNK